MIGSDEFNFRSVQPTSSSTGDISDMEYIETFLTSSGSMQSEARLLIDIVCPQPQSQPRSSVSSANGQSTAQAARTNSTNSWRK